MHDSFSTFLSISSQLNSLSSEKNIKFFNYTFPFLASFYYTFHIEVVRQSSLVIKFNENASSMFLPTGLFFLLYEVSTFVFFASVICKIINWYSGIIQGCFLLWPLDVGNRIDSLISLTLWANSYSVILYGHLTCQLKSFYKLIDNNVNHKFEFLSYYFVVN